MIKSSQNVEIIFQKHGVVKHVCRGQVIKFGSGEACGCEGVEFYSGSSGWSRDFSSSPPHEKVVQKVFYIFLGRNNVIGVRVRLNSNYKLIPFSDLKDLLRAKYAEISRTALNHIVEKIKSEN